MDVAPKDPEVMGVFDPLTPHVPQATSSTVQTLMTKALVWWFVLLVALAAVRLQRSSSSNKANRKRGVKVSASSRAATTVVLCGPLAAGKTALLAKLAYGAAPQTHTSIKENEASITSKQATPAPSLVASDEQQPDNDSTQEQLARPLHAVDTPGHPRLRTRSLAQFLPVADGVVFVVDAATGLSGKNIRDAAEHLHVVLCLLATLVNADRSAEPARLLILLSKADLVPALSSSASSNVPTPSSTDSPVSPSLAVASKSSTLALDRAKQSLAREMDRRRQATLGGGTTTGTSSSSTTQLAGAKLEGLDAIPVSSTSSTSFLQSILSKLGFGASGIASAASSSSAPSALGRAQGGLPNDENEVLSNSELAFPFEGAFEWDKLKEFVEVQWAVASVGSIGGGGSSGSNGAAASTTKAVKPAQLQGLWQWIEQL
ncbi:hypothetical protein ACM66B_004874 [Microbotryomycetes sp. NB124-2]